jgi:predicted membrane protein (TIGR00267 family)
MRSENLIFKLYHIINVSKKLLNAIKYSIKHDSKPILRRYIVIGAFDGITYVISTLVAIIFSGLPFEKASTTIYTGLIAIALSSAWNSLIVEAKEKNIELRRLEQQVLRSLKGTTYELSVKISIILSVISHGISPFLGLIPVLVYIVSNDLLISVISSLIALGVLGFLYEGSVKNKLKSISFMVIAGIFAILVAIYLNH